MKTQVLTLLCAATLLATAGLVSAATQQLVTADIPFEFTAGTGTFPAGKYEIGEADSANAGMLVLRQAETGKVALVNCITRLASRDNDRNILVFDHIGDQHILSELHLEDRDGYLVSTTKTEHTHRSVPVQRKH